LQKFNFWVVILETEESYLLGISFSFDRLIQKKTAQQKKNFSAHQLIRHCPRELGQFLNTFTNWNWKDQKIGTLYPYLKLSSIKEPWLSDLTYNGTGGFLKTW